MSGRFRRYVLAEQTEFLGKQIGDILSALKSLAEDAGRLGQRQIIRVSDQIVDDMRRILKGRWPSEDYRHLQELQKVAVYLKKACDSNEKPLTEVVQACKAAIEALVGELGTPINDAGGGGADGDAPPPPQQ